MYEIAICDDDMKYIGELEEMLLECNAGKRKVRFWEYTSGEELLAGRIDDMDAIFLDIQMEEMNGNEISVELKERGYQGILVQCSGIFMPTPETIKISPYRYLLKQSAKNETLKELLEIFDELDRRKICSEIEGSYQREKMKFRVADIVYITHHANGNSILHLKKSVEKKFEKGNIIVAYNFDELLEMLESADFVLPHNSHIVNMRFISSINKNGFLVADGKSLSISRGMRDKFLEKWFAYGAGKYKRKEK